MGVINFYEDSKKQAKEAPPSDKLHEISRLVKKLKNNQSFVKYSEDETKVYKKVVNDISSNQIPDIFDELGLEKVVLNDGQEVKIDKKFSASIPKDYTEFCHDWLNKNGHGSIIKDTITITFKKGDKENVEKVIDFLDGLGLSWKQKESVHYQTLQAFVNEIKKKGKDIPEKEFSIFPVRQTKIK